MDAMMSSLMSRATSRLYPGNVTKPIEDDAPLDLSWAHTLVEGERFITKEDLRPEECLESEDDSSCRSSLGQHGDASFVKTESSPRDSNQSTSNNHPFSIESIVGKQTLEASVPEVTEPARVFRRHQGTSNMYFQSFYETLFNNSLHRSMNSNYNDQDKPRTVTGTDVFWCHVCNEFCTSKDDATRHQIGHRVRGSVTKLQRSVFQRHGFVTSHERGISDNTIRCGLCSKDVSLCFFSKHQQLHNGHVCDVCNREFSTNGRLQDHMNIHTGSASFQCAVCDRKFAKKSSLTQHKRYHKNHQAFQCQFCSQKCNSKYACAVHERRHTGNNPYVCDVPGCDRAYPQKIQLKLHMYSHRHVNV